MVGIIEQILIRRYGKPVLGFANGLTECIWNSDSDKECTLYKDANDTSPPLHPELSDIYGDVLGGTLAGGDLKLAMVRGPALFGLYTVTELEEAVRFRFPFTDSDIRFFIDSGNVWFYGKKGADLYVLDMETEEIDSLGDLEGGLTRVLDEWDRATG